MKLNNHEASKFADLQKSFVGGGGSAKIGVEQVNQIGDILMNDYAKQNKKFNTAVVADIISKKLGISYENCANPEQALKTAARKVLVDLRVIPAPVKKTPAPKDTTAPAKDNV